eukprot:tig00000073_g1704.t1
MMLSCGACGAEGAPLQCSRCKCAYFCGKACFKGAWALHKHVCNTRYLSVFPLEPHLEPPPEPAPTAPESAPEGGASDSSGDPAPALADAAAPAGSEGSAGAGAGAGAGPATPEAAAAAAAAPEPWYDRRPIMEEVLKRRRPFVVKAQLPAQGDGVILLTNRARWIRSLVPWDAPAYRPLQDRIRGRRKDALKAYFWGYALRRSGGDGGGEEGGATPAPAGTPEGPSSPDELELRLFLDSVPDPVPTW